MIDSNDQSKKLPEQWEGLRQALLTTRPTRSYNRPGPELAAFLDTLDALDFDIALYLILDLKVNCDLIPKLVPLIDRSCFEERLRFQIDDILKKLDL
jgi:hypothetical protein